MMIKQSLKWFALTLFALLMASYTSTVLAQDADPYSVGLVKNLLQFPANIGSGFSEKQLNRLGDKASIALLKILSAEDLKDASKARNSLLIIRNSFMVPNLIANREDKNPGVTLFFLIHLERDSTDAVLRREISDTIRFVKSKTSGR